MKITRTEVWPLEANDDIRVAIRDTITVYRRYVSALATVCMTHWPEIAPLSKKDRLTLVESMIHPTSKRPKIRYAYFHRSFYKFPSYLRRAAIHDAIGCASSFLTRYDQWQSHERRRFEKERPPRFHVGNVYPSLYKGNMILYADDWKSAEIKLFINGDWVWRSVRIIRTGHRVNDVKNKLQSPQLILSKKGLRLSVPFERNIELGPQRAKIIASVDLGINTCITVSIVREDGTVLARKFLHNGRDMDQIHRRLDAITERSKKTGRKKKKGFCRGRYRKAGNIAKAMAHDLTRQLVTFAHEHGATTIVFENMKGWRPKGRGQNGKQRFHTWLHRRIVTFTELKWRPLQGRMAFVPPRGTSSNAYDGSGKVKRDKSNYSIARFPGGKVYNADLNATYNISARYFLRDNNLLTHRDTGQTSLGRNPSGVPRTPETLSLLWHANAH